MRERVVVRLVAALGLASSACGTLLVVSSDDAAADGSARAGPDADAGQEPRDAADDDAPNREAAAPDRPRAVFVTRATTQGNIGGLQRADTICNGEAREAGLGTSFVAWLSVSSLASSGEDDRPVDALARLSPGAAWHLVRGARVFASLDAVRSGAPPEAAIVVDAWGTRLPEPLGNVWTGTFENGTKDRFDCNGWSDEGGEGVRGIVGAVDRTWTSGHVGRCWERQRLICFEK